MTSQIDCVSCDPNCATCTPDEVGEGCTACNAGWYPKTDPDPTGICTACSQISECTMCDASDVTGKCTTCNAANGFYNS